MLKFLVGREEPKVPIKIDKMQQSSNSYLPLNKMFNSPLHQDTSLSTRPKDYITKCLPPIETYNPLTQKLSPISRPEYIVRQRDLYKSRYLTELRKGFKKKEGIFESFQHVLNKNKLLIQDVHSKESLPSVNNRRQSYLRVEEQQKLTRASNKQPKHSIHSQTEQGKSLEVLNNQPSSQRVGSQQIFVSQIQSQSEFNAFPMKSRKDYRYEFEEKYREDMNKKLENEQMMHLLSIFDKKLVELKAKKAEDNKKLLII